MFDELVKIKIKMSIYKTLLPLIGYGVISWNDVVKYVDLSRYDSGYCDGYIKGLRTITNLLPKDDAPYCKIKKRDGQYILSVPVPGVDPATIAVTTKNSVLNIQLGTVRYQMKSGLLEDAVGDDEVDMNGITTTYKLGILYISIPICEPVVRVFPLLIENVIEPAVREEKTKGTEDDVVMTNDPVGSCSTSTSASKTDE